MEVKSIEINNKININEENKNDSLYKINKIKEKLPKSEENEKLISNLYETNETQEIYEKMDGNSVQDEKSKENKNSSLIGKKRNNSENSGKYHNKYTSDNIVKKIKIHIFEKMLNFLKNILPNKMKKLIKKPDAKYIERLKKDENLRILDMKLKDFFSSYPISTQYNDTKKKKNKNNKKIIEKIYVQSKNNKVIMFAMDITVRKWIDIFTYKIDLSDYIKKEDVELIKEINNKLERVDKLLNEELEKLFEDKLTGEFDIRYYHLFVIYLYNYERFFSIKKGRER